MRVVHQGIVLGCVVLLSALFVPEVEAWGDMRHAIICEIAFHELNPPAREAVQRLIQQTRTSGCFRKPARGQTTRASALASTSSTCRAPPRVLGTIRAPWTPRVW
jgi:hypothetical protein